MAVFSRRVVLTVAALASIPFTQTEPTAQSPRVQTIAATSGAELRAADTEVNQLIRQGQLVVSTDRDPAMPSRTIERMQQIHEGVPVFGMTVVRDAERGTPISIFGAIAPDLTVSVEPLLTVDSARTALMRALGAQESVAQTKVELSILPLASEYRLTYTAVIAGSGRIARIFIDARSGTELLRFSEMQTQAAVGTGRGVLGDTKKLSVVRRSGVFMADDQLRPPVFKTYDFRGNLERTLNMVLLNGPLPESDLATDSDNEWSDAFNVDAHVHVGWTYDYYFKRFGRKGLDDRDRAIVIVTNGVSQQGALSLPSNLAAFGANAFWCGTCGPNGVGLMFFGNGIPSNYFFENGRTIGFMAGALDVAAHELTHAVIGSSSRLTSLNEPGALNEAFADIIGTSVEFFYQTAGTGLGKADYLIGEDVVRAVRSGVVGDGLRSLQNPQLFGDRDHYSKLYRGPVDDGGVHTNSGIASHAFYLAIEGGVNATSELGVQGVGAANRQQIEAIFYRAFVFLMPSSASFSIARAATVQAARDLYGPASAAERAVTQAWTAVGVN